MSDKILFTNDVIEMTHIARETISKWIKEERFPKPFKIAGKNVWYESSINNWIKEQHDSQVDL